MQCLSRRHVENSEDLNLVGQFTAELSDLLDTNYKMSWSLAGDEGEGGFETVYLAQLTRTSDVDEIRRPSPLDPGCENTLARARASTSLSYLHHKLARLNLHAITHSGSQVQVQTESGISIEVPCLSRHSIK